jgi:DNA repair exonuclease SbcCD ATPase subunit
VSRTISVKEAASALGITPRAVTYRLEKGQLKGTLNKNEFGVPEWRIYPNKEIMSGLNTQPDSVTTGPINFEPEDVVEAESVESPAEAKAEQENEPRFTSEFQAIVEQCVRPLVDEVKAQALALAEKDRIIEDQNRQLRLLPDLQKKAEEERQQAEKERKEAELRALEVEALNKQVAAMEEERQELEEKARQANALKSDLEQLKSKVEELQRPWWKRWLSSGASDSG